MGFQQDGALSHYANFFRNLLNEKLDGRWIGRRGSVEWPARSPDLTPLDSFFLGVMKYRVYAQKIRDIEHLNESIKREVEVIPADQDLLRKVCNLVTCRVGECINSPGGHCEKYR